MNRSILPSPPAFLATMAMAWAVPVTLTAEHIKIYVLAGQSNAAGDAASNTFDPVYQQTRNDIEFWHQGSATNSVALQPGSGNKTSQSGPELTLGRQLADAQASSNIAIVKHAVSGSFISQWDPTASDKAYSKMLAKVQAAQRVITDRGDSYEMGGMFWWQGESDVSDAALSQAYEAKLSALITACRADFGRTDMPFVAALLPFYYDNKARNAVLNQGIRNAVQAAGDADYIGLDDSFLHDPFHYEAKVYQMAGFRAANTLMALDGALTLSSPVAINDEFNIGKDTTLNVPRGGSCLVNDTDADSQQLAAALVTHPTNGTLQDLDGNGLFLSELGEFIYLPTAGFVGTDTFTYRVSDKDDSGSVGTININVLEPGNVDAGMVVYWPMEGSVSDQAPAGQDVDGVLQGATINADGLIGQRLKAGQNKFVTLNGTDMSPPWSASYWVKRSGDVIKGKVFLENNNNRIMLGSFERTERAGIEKGNGRHYFDYRRTGGVWRHFVLINNGTTMVLYADGVRVNPLEVSINLPLGGTIGLNSKESVNGSLDEVAIWNRELNATEVASLHYRGHAGLTVDAPLTTGVPSADAGPDQNVPDTDSAPGESVILDGSASIDPGGSITSCVWTENGSQIATGETPTVILADGSHTITLTLPSGDDPWFLRIEPIAGYSACDLPVVPTNKDQIPFWERLDRLRNRSCANRIRADCSSPG